jgi:hypothetical protein
LAFLDSDDIWYPDYLEKQTDALNKLPETVGMVCCSIRRRKGESDIIMKSEILDLSYEGLLRCGDGWCTSSFLIRAASFKQIGGFALEYSSFQDFDFLLRMSAEFQIATIADVLLDYCLGHDSISMNMTSKAKGLERIIDVYRSDLLRLGLLGTYLFRTGQYYILSGCLTKGWRCWARALRYNPLRVKTWKHLLMTSAGHGRYRQLLRWNSKR